MNSHTLSRKYISNESFRQDKTAANAFYKLLFLFVGGLSIHEPCKYDQQCTGTENAQTCSAIKGEEQSILRCVCNDGFIDINSTCYRGNTNIKKTLKLCLNE